MYDAGKKTCDMALNSGALGQTLLIADACGGQLEVAAVERF